MLADPVVIAAAARTPMGAFQGSLSTVTATALGAAAVRAAVERGNVLTDLIDRIYMGCVLPAGLGQAPARQAALGAGLPLATRATTVNKMCGSGMEAVILAHDVLAAGSADLVVAGGMESMSNAPFLLARNLPQPQRGRVTCVDHMYLDGLEDAYQPGVLMGVFADRAAARHGFNRAEQDAYAEESLRRAKSATTSGAFDAEIAPITVATKASSILISDDEQPLRADPAKIPRLKAAFIPDGTVTAASSSSISDGAAALVLSRASAAERLGLEPLAKLVSHAGCADEPANFAALPAVAISRALERAGWNVGNVDLFEVNEAFAVVALIAMREVGIPHERINVNGGACALGHPIGASGARILVTLLNALRDRGLRRGVASICIGGGEATAVALELV